MYACLFPLPVKGVLLPGVSAKLAEMSEETNYFTRKTPPRLPSKRQTFLPGSVLFPACAGRYFCRSRNPLRQPWLRIQAVLPFKTACFGFQNGLFRLPKRPVSASKTGRFTMPVAMCRAIWMADGCCCGVISFATSSHIFGQMAYSAANNIMCAPTISKKDMSEMQSKVKLRKILVEILCPKEKTPYLCIRFRG